jgi:hypothetical protein
MAAQRYGIVGRDRADSIAFYAEDPTPARSPEFARVLAGQTPGRALASFPWNRLEVVAPGG